MVESASSRQFAQTVVQFTRGVHFPIPDADPSVVGPVKRFWNVVVFNMLPEAELPHRFEETEQPNLPARGNLRN